MDTCLSSRCIVTSHSSGSTTPPFRYCVVTIWSQDSSVGIATTLLARRLRKYGLTPGRDKRFFCSPLPWAHPVPVQWTVSPEVKQQGHEADHSPVVLGLRMVGLYLFVAST
jgi:hypothetical protein